jgi:hypothetical protein
MDGQITAFRALAILYFLWLKTTYSRIEPRVQGDKI